MTHSRKPLSGSGDAQPDLTLETFLPYRLNVLAETVSLALSRLYAEHYGIGIPEWRVIATLGQYRRMSAKDVGAHSHMHKTKVSRAVSALERKKLLIRDPNPNDMREAFLSLTDDGRRIYIELAPRVRAFSEQLLGNMDAAELEAFERVIDRLSARAQVIVDGGDDQDRSGGDR